MNDNTTIAKKIRAQRKLLGIPQAALAKKVGVTYQQIQKYENGKNSIPLIRLTKLCEALSLQITDIFVTDKKIDICRDIPVSAIDLARYYSKLPEHQQKAVLSLIKKLST